MSNLKMISTIIHIKGHMGHKNPIKPIKDNHTDINKQIIEESIDDNAIREIS